MILIPRSGSTDLSQVVSIYSYRWSSSDPTRILESTDTRIFPRRSYYKGYGIPDFHARRRRGELLPNTPWRTFKVDGSGSGYYYSQSKSTPYWVAREILNYPPRAEKYEVTENDCSTTSEDAKIFVQEAAAAIYSSGFDLLTFAAEIVTLRAMFEDALRKLLKLDFPKSGKKLSDDWLSVRYGWRTLLYDIQDIQQLISTFNEKRQERLSEIRGTTTSTSNTDEVIHIPYGGIGYADEIWHIEKTISLRGGVIADITIPKIQANLAITAWELVPFSFVIDWFVSIGKSLSALMFLAVQKDYQAFTGYKITAKKSYRLDGYDFNSGVGEVWQAGESTGTLKIRQPCSVPYTPRTSLRLSPTKILDLLALVVQRTRR